MSLSSGIAFLRVLGTIQRDGSTGIAIVPNGKHPELGLQEIPMRNSTD
jgi:hypothetical protein